MGRKCGRACQSSIICLTCKRPDSQWRTFQSCNRRAAPACLGMEGWPVGGRHHGPRKTRDRKELEWLFSNQIWNTSLRTAQLVKLFQLFEFQIKEAREKDASAVGFVSSLGAEVDVKPRNIGRGQYSKAQPWSSFVHDFSANSRRTLEGL